MKITVLPFVIAALGLAAQVSAGPVRIYVLAPEHTDVSQSDKAAPSPAFDASVAHMRWGLAAAEAPQPVPQPMIKIMGGVHRHGEDKDSMSMRKHRCGGRVRMKAIALSNWLREKVGLAPIAPPPPPPHLHFPHGRPMPHRPESVHGDASRVLPISFHGSSQAGKHEGDAADVEGTPHFHHFHHHPHPHHRHGRPSSLSGRVQQALMTLGPWEGRLVAFVIGCGIGSLLRMFYVLCVLAYRSFVPRKDEEEEIDVIFTDVEEVPPPVYLVDDKIAPVDEKVSA